LPPAARALVRLETVFDEKERHAVLAVTAAEKRANMTCFAELGAGKRNGSCDRVHIEGRSGIDQKPKRMPAIGFHPHSGIEAVTVVLQGQLSYQETSGTEGVIAAAKLGISPSTLEHRIRALKINKRLFKYR